MKLTTVGQTLPLYELTDFLLYKFDVFFQLVQMLGKQ